MKPKPLHTSNAAELRRRVEEHLSKQVPEAETSGSGADSLRLLHELQVHQIELQMQNAELQQARTALETEKEKYSDLYDFAPVGYLTLDPDGSIVEANLTSASLLGIERSQLIKRRFGLFVSPSDLPAFNRFLGKIFASQTRESVEVSLLRKDHPAVEARLEAVACTGGRECRVAMMDITGQKLAERNRFILAKLESTGVLAAGIAHDFNNLLTVILLNLELSQNRSAGHEDDPRCLTAAKQAALSARSLSQQLVTFATGGASVRRATELGPLIQESARLALIVSNVQSEFNLNHDLWPVEVDPEQIGQVLRNVVQNAREAMPDGGRVVLQAENVTLTSPVTPGLPPGDYVRVRISDQGGGIAEENLPKIYDPYFSTKQRGEQRGMGLGLTVCHSIIQKHGGAITMESELGTGTTVLLHLPASRKPAPPKQAPDLPANRRCGKILVVDDEAGVRMVMGALLGRMGHEVKLAEDGATAVEDFRRARAGGEPFDLVVLDLTLKQGMSGLETMQRLREIEPGVAAIIMSGYADNPVLQEYERHGFRGAIAKPFHTEEFQELLARAMDRCADGRIMP
jgi:PAS domain S-box-containing protein